MGDEQASADVVEEALTAAAAHFDQTAGQHRPCQPDRPWPAGPPRDLMSSWLYAAARRGCVTRQAEAADSDGPGDSGGSGASGLPAGAAGDTGSSATGSARAQEAVAEALTAEYAASDLDAEDRRRHVLVVRQVLGGLHDADVEVLSLAVRHGLSERDLSIVLAIPLRRARAFLSEATEKFGQLAVATVLLSAGWSGCKKLDRLVGGSFVDAPDEELCRRITRHSKSCATCGPIVAIRGFGPELLSVLSIPRLPAAVARRLGSAPSLDAPPTVPPGPLSTRPQSPGPARTTAPPAPFPPVADPGPAASPPGAPAPPARPSVWSGPESVRLDAPGRGYRGRGAPVELGPDDQGRAGLVGAYHAPNGAAGNGSVTAGLLSDGPGSGDVGRQGPGRNDRDDDDRDDEDQRPGGPWLTRARVGLLAAAAVLVIVGGAVTASKLISGSPGDSGVPSAQNTSSAPGSQPSGTAPSSSGTTAPARSSGKAGSTAHRSNGIFPGQSYYPSSSATATSGSTSTSPKPRPSSPKPKPSSPKPKPSSSSPPPTSPPPTSGP